MKFVQTLLQRWKQQQSPKKITGIIVVVHWDRENLYYFISTSKSHLVRTQDAGVLAYDAQQSPLVALAEYFKQHEIVVQQLVVLLSRPELEQLSLTLPPSSDDELPALVASAVEQQLGESEVPPTVDYCTLPIVRPETDTAGINVLAFAMTPGGLNSLQRDAEQAGFKLIAIASRQLSALALLAHIEDLAQNLNIVLHLYPGEAELAICVGSQPQLLRSVRVNLDELDRTVEQMRREVQRCLALLPHEVEELPQQWMVFDTCIAASQIAQLLDRSIYTKVACVDPMSQWSFSGPLQIIGQKSAQPVQSPTQSPTDDTATGKAADSAESLGAEEIRSEFSQEPVLRCDAVNHPTAALTGAASEIWRDGLSINLVHPKRAPAAPRPWVRPAAWTAAGLLAASVGGYALKRDVWQLQKDVELMQQEVKDSGKLAAKYMEKSDQAKVVENWVSDNVDWLTVLDEVSSRLPTGQNATVTRLSASSDGAQGVLDLSVQVTDPEQIALLEDRLRSVKYSVNSKRISQTPEASEYPWRFETRITFPIEQADWRDFGAAAKAANNATNAPAKPTEKKTQPDKQTVKQIDYPSDSPLKSSTVANSQVNDAREEDR
jgi:hypothetical protein